MQTDAHGPDINRIAVDNPRFTGDFSALHLR